MLSAFSMVVLVTVKCLRSRSISYQPAGLRGGVLHTAT